MPKSDTSNNQLDGGRGAMRHMGLAVTLASGIGGGAWLGSRWDATSEHEVQWATALCAMLGLAASMTIVLKDLKR